MSMTYSNYVAWKLNNKNKIFLPNTHQVTIRDPIKSRPQTQCCLHASISKLHHIELLHATHGYPDGWKEYI